MSLLAMAVLPIAAVRALFLILFPITLAEVIMLQSPFAVRGRASETPRARVRIVLVPQVHPACNGPVVHNDRHLRIDGRQLPACTPRSESTQAGSSPSVAVSSLRSD